MANGKIRFGKQSGGQLALVIPDGVTNTEVVLPESGILATEQYVDGKYSGFKNYIINGNFDIWQRGTSQTSNGYDSDDRWANLNGGSTKTHSQVSSTDTERALFNSSMFSRTVVTSVAGIGNYAIKQQGIENVTKLAGKTVTLSFWARADSAKKIAIEFIQNFGTGVAPSSEITGIGSQTVALTSTWQKKTITLAIPSIVGKTLGTDGVHTTKHYLIFWFDSGSNFNSRSASLGQQSGTFDIAQVQLEEGSIATPFENRPYGLELSLCQRYFEVGSMYIIGNTILNGYVGGTISFNTEKRVIPTITPTNVFENSGNNVGFQINHSSRNAFRLYTSNTTNSTQVIMSANYYASAEL